MRISMKNSNNSKNDDDFQKYLRDLENTNWSVRTKAIFQLKNYDNPVIADALVDRLNDSNENVWVSAVNVLRDKKDPRLVNSLIKMLSI